MQDGARLNFRLSFNDPQLSKVRAGMPKPAPPPLPPPEYSHTHAGGCALPYYPPNDDSVVQAFAEQDGATMAPSFMPFAHGEGDDNDDADADDDGGQRHHHHHHYCEEYIHHHHQDDHDSNNNIEAPSFGLDDAHDVDAVGDHGDDNNPLASAPTHPRFIGNNNNNSNHTSSANNNNAFVGGFFDAGAVELIGGGAGEGIDAAAIATTTADIAPIMMLGVDYGHGGNSNNNNNHHMGVASALTGPSGTNGSLLAMNEGGGPNNNNNNRNTGGNNNNNNSAFLSGVQFLPASLYQQQPQQPSLLSLPASNNNNNGAVGHGMQMQPNNNNIGGSTNNGNNSAAASAMMLPSRGSNAFSPHTSSFPAPPNLQQRVAHHPQTQANAAPLAEHARGGNSQQPQHGFNPELHIFASLLRNLSFKRMLLVQGRYACALALLPLLFLASTHSSAQRAACVHLLFMPLTAPPLQTFARIGGRFTTLLCGSCLLLGNAAALLLLLSPDAVSVPHNNNKAHHEAAAATLMNTAAASKGMHRAHRLRSARNHTVIIDGQRQRDGSVSLLLLNDDGSGDNNNRAALAQAGFYAYGDDEDEDGAGGSSDGDNGNNNNANGMVVMPAPNNDEAEKRGRGGDPRNRDGGARRPPSPYEPYFRQSGKHQQRAQGGGANGNANTNPAADGELNRNHPSHAAADEQESAALFASSSTQAIAFYMTLTAHIFISCTLCIGCAQLLLMVNKSNVIKVMGCTAAAVMVAALALAAALSSPSLARRFFQTATLPFLLLFLEASSMSASSSATSLTPIIFSL